MRKLSEIIEIGLKAAIQMPKPHEFGMCCILIYHMKNQRGHGLFRHDVQLDSAEVALFQEWIHKYLHRGALYAYLLDALEAKRGRVPTKQEWITWYRDRVRYLKKTNR